MEGIEVSEYWKGYIDGKKKAKSDYKAEIDELKKEIGELRKHQARLRSWLQEGCC